MKRKPVKTLEQQLTEAQSSLTGVKRTYATCLQENRQSLAETIQNVHIPYYQDKIAHLLRLRQDGEKGTTSK